MDSCNSTKLFNFKLINASPTYTNIDHELINPLLLIIPLSLSNEKGLDHFPIHSIQLYKCIKQTKTRGKYQPHLTFDSTIFKRKISWSGL